MIKSVLNLQNQNKKDTNISTEAVINIIDTFCVQPVLGSALIAVGVAVSEAIK